LIVGGDDKAAAAQSIAQTNTESKALTDLK